LLFFIFSHVVSIWFLVLAGLFFLFISSFCFPFLFLFYSILPYILFTRLSGKHTYGTEAAIVPFCTKKQNKKQNKKQKQKQKTKQKQNVESFLAGAEP